jgi:hypothetical protein
LVSGSSFAAAHVSGLVALMRQRSPADAPLKLASASAGGAIDACASLLHWAAGCNCGCARLVETTTIGRR